MEVIVPVIIYYFSVSNITNQREKEKRVLFIFFKIGSNEEREATEWTKINVEDMTKSRLCA